MHFVPAFLSPPLVARIDRVPTRVVLPALYAAEAAAFAILALLADDFSLPAILALAVFDGSIASAARALTRAAAGAVLEPAGALREGNALLNVAFTVGVGGRARDRRARRRRRRDEHRACSPTRSRSSPSRCSSSSPAACPTRALEIEPGGWRERLRGGLSYVASAPSCAACSAPRAWRSSSSRS